MAKKSITWTNEKRKLSDLIPWEHNPRTIKQKQAERLVDSVATFGQVETLAIGPANELYNGHQRLSVLAGEYGMDYEVDVRVASRPLSERERQQLTVYLHRGATGDFAPEMLFDWDFDSLIEWGFDEIADVMEAAELTTIGDAPSSANNDRALGDKSKQIKPVIYTDEIEDFERAILATGERNRGKAIMAICRFYLEQHDDGKEEGQFNLSFENFAA